MSAQSVGVVIAQGWTGTEAARSGRAIRSLAACAGAAAVLTLAAAPAMGRTGGAGPQQLSFEMLIAGGDMIEGVDHPVLAFSGVAVNNRGMYALNGRADSPGIDQRFVATDRGLAMGPNLANIPVEHDGVTAMATLRGELTSIDLNNQGNLVTRAWPNNAIFGEFEEVGVYVANRNGTVERVMSYEEPLPWWTGGESEFNYIGSTLKISDDDRVLVEGNASILGGTNITHISKFERDPAPGSTPSSGWLHTNVAAHGMPVADGVYIGGAFFSTMASNGRIVLTSVASLPAPNGFGYTLFDEGVPVLQQGQPAPAPGYFIDSMFLSSANAAGDFIVGMNMTLQPGAPDNIGMVYNSRRGPVYAEDGLAQQLGVPISVIGPVQASSKLLTDDRANSYFTATLLMPSGEVLAGLWKNTELLIPLGMDIGDGRTITSFGSHFDVSDNGRWVVFIASLSDGTGGAMRVYVPAPGVAAMLALTATITAARRQRSVR